MGAAISAGAGIGTAVDIGMGAVITAVGMVHRTFMTGTLTSIRPTMRQFMVATRMASVGTAGADTAIGAVMAATSAMVATAVANRIQNTDSANDSPGGRNPPGDCVFVSAGRALSVRGLVFGVRGQLPPICFVTRKRSLMLYSPS